MASYINLYMYSFVMFHGNEVKLEMRTGTYSRLILFDLED